MKKQIVFGLLLLFIARPVSAKNSFDGPYVGISAGLGIGHLDVSQSTNNNSTGRHFSDSSSKLSPLGVLGGVHLGWNKTLSNKYVIGLEVWGDASSLDEKLKETNGEMVDMQSKAQMDWSIGVALKGGVVMRDGLAYISLGWVGSEWKTKTNVVGYDVMGNVSNTQNFSDKKFLSGFRPAVGYTWSVNKRLDVSAEGAYTFYSRHKTTHPFNFSGMNTTASTKNQPEVGELRVKFSWKVLS
ncbi:MAG: hypothetical protein ABFQ95_04405 [Pseudomonadota bacterium]